MKLKTFSVRTEKDLLLHRLQLHNVYTLVASREEGIFCNLLS